MLNLRVAEWERLQRKSVVLPGGERVRGVPQTAGEQRGVKSWEVQGSEHGMLGENSYDGGGEV